MPRLGIEVNNGYAANRYTPHSRAGGFERRARDVSALLETRQAPARPTLPLQPFIAALKLALAVWRD